MPEQTWTEYRFEAFGEPYMVWHDGPDFTEFAARAKADPATAERMVLQGLAETDALAAQAMTQADFPPAARERMVAALKGAIDRTNTTFRVSVARALTALTGEQHWSAAIVDVLLGGPFWGDRLDAAMALGRYRPTAELIAALVAGVQDDEYLVRYHSCNSLLSYAGEGAGIYEHQEMFTQIADGSTPQSRALVARTLAAAASARLSAARVDEVEDGRGEKR